MLLEEEAPSQVNWILGPEVIQTCAGYKTDFILKNNVLAKAEDDNFLGSASYVLYKRLSPAWSFSRWPRRTGGKNEDILNARNDECHQPSTATRPTSAQAADHINV
jgi:hypothetical protein